MITGLAMTRQGKQIVQTISEKKDLELDHFTASEFGLFWLFMSNDLLRKLDQFRAMWGDKVIISPASGAIGRRLDEGHSNYGSMHNILKWGEVRAIDVMPVGMVTAEDRRRAVDRARLVGFTGIGVYPDWQPRPGLHLDVRDGAEGTWSAFRDDDGNQEYFALARALGGTG